jgi:putative transposase
MRKVQLATNEYYHIYNRGVDKRNVFTNEADYWRFFEAMYLANDERDGLIKIWKDYQRFNPKAKLWEFAKFSFGRMNPMVEIVAYCLNPNHYHFILKQITKRGIEKFMQKIGTSYTKHFNQKYDRSGSLFQGTFKSSHIKPNTLLYLSAYVNCNSEIHGIAKAQSYRWCSFSDYLGKREKRK